MKKYASDHDGSVKNNFFVKKLTFVCFRGHEFMLSFNKYKDRWCEKCEKHKEIEEKKEIKRILQLEEEKMNQEYEEK